MNHSIYISDLRRSVINTDTDKILFIYADTSSYTNSSSAISKITNVPISKHCITSSYSHTVFGNLFDQSLNTSDNVTFNSMLLSGSSSIEVFIGSGYTLPDNTGNIGQTIVTDGNGNTGWANIETSSYSNMILMSGVTSSGSYSILQSGSSDITIPDLTNQIFSLTVLGVEGSGRIGRWDLSFIVSNDSVSSSFIGNVRNGDLMIFNPITGSCEIYNQSIIANQLTSASVKLEMIQGDSLRLSVSNPHEVTGSYTTTWQACAEFTTLNTI